MSTGITALLAQIFSAYHGADAMEAVIGKTIASLRLDPAYNGGDGGLLFAFTDGTGIALYDDGRSCCENRYMNTDDDLAAFVGAQLVGADVRDGPNIDDEYGAHEMQFLIVRTSLGDFTMETHNEHNGYYGGFVLTSASYENSTHGGVE